MKTKIIVNEQQYYSMKADKRYLLSVLESGECSGNDRVAIGKELGLLNKSIEAYRSVNPRLVFYKS